MEIKGKIIQILEKKSGTSSNGNWTKQGFIVETTEQFPKKIFVTDWNDKLNVSAFLNQSITVYVNIESREYKGNWYTDIKAWKIDQDKNNNTPNQIIELPKSEDDESDILPF